MVKRNSSSYLRENDKNFSEKDIYVFTDSKTVKKLESKIKNLYILIKISKWN